LRPFLVAACGAALLLSVGAGGGREAIAQRPPQWGDMESGPHAVGFRVIRGYDHTRSYWPPVGYDGKRDSLETARPIQISVWYPAADSVTGQRMAFGEHVALEGEALGLERATPQRRAEAEQSLRRGPLNPYFPGGITDEQLRRVLATPTASVREAAPAGGPFPLLIHLGSTVGQTVLLEYLASHGYVVASIPVLGTAPAWFGRGEGTPEAHLASAADVGFVLATVGALPYADGSRAAVMGMLTAGGLLFQMQHQQLRAMAVLDGSYPESLRRAPGFDLHAVRIPLLDMPRSGALPDRAMLDSMRYADRYLVRFDSVTHADFYQFRRIAHPERAAEHVSYRIIARYTLAFLDHVLKQDTMASRFLSADPHSAGAPERFLTVAHRPAIQATPTAEEFLLLVRNGDIREARRAWKTFQESGAHRPLVEESPMTITLFFYRRDQGPANSADAFRLLVEMFPDSWRAREHLATTYQQANDAESARDAYREAIRLLGTAPMPAAEREEHQRRLEALLAAQPSSRTNPSSR
jgi:hypothetical protein